MTSPSIDHQYMSDAPDDPMDAPGTRSAVSEMAALTRVLFGVSAPLRTTTQPDASLPEAPPHPAVHSVPVTGIPVPDGTPAARPVASAAPIPVAPASLPVPEIPVLASVPEPAERATEPARESPRRPAGPSLELLQEISFLEE